MNRKSGFLAVAVCAATLFGAATVTAPAAADSTSQGPRDPWIRPFAANSIWNTPIGSNAVYVDAALPLQRANAADRAYFATTDAGDPVRNVRRPFAWRDRCNTQSPVYSNVVIPDDFFAEDARKISATKWRTPNNQGAILQPDGRTLVDFAAMCRDQRGGDVYGHMKTNGNFSDLYGPGLGGAHGASGMSSLGGAIRPGELTNDAPINHVLDVVLYAKYAATTNGDCRRWPARRCDAYAAASHPSNRGRYQGSIPELQMGSLLALPASLQPSDLGISTPAGAKLFRAFQDWGAYWTEDSAWEANYLTVDAAAQDDAALFRGRPVQDDFAAIIAAANVVDNNDANSIGGGGTPRALPHVNEFTTGVVTTATTPPPTTSPAPPTPPTTAGPVTTEITPTTVGVHPEEPEVSEVPLTTAPPKTPTPTTQLESLTTTPVPATTTPVPATTTPPTTVTPPTTTSTSTTTSTAPPTTAAPTAPSTVPPAPRGDKFADWFSRAWLGGDWTAIGSAQLGIRNEAVSSIGGDGEGLLLRNAESPNGSIEAIFDINGANVSMGLVARAEDTENFLLASVVRTRGKNEISIWTVVDNRWVRYVADSSVVVGGEHRLTLRAEGRQVSVDLNGKRLLETTISQADARALNDNILWGIRATRPSDSGNSNVDKVIYRP